MSKTVKTNLLLLFFAVFITLVIYSCGDDPVTNNNNPTTFNINGTITYADTTRVYSGGSYTISAFTSWPPTGAPSAFALVNPVKNGNVYTGAYSVTALANGKYYLASAWTKEPYVANGNFVLGTYGCDTNSIFTCSPDSVVINGSNVTNINFYSYIDTSKALIRF